MTDKQKALVSLTLALETCTATLAALKTDGPDALDAQPDLHVLQQDFTSLLSLLYGSTTKVALSLKPSSPTYSASLGPLRDISTHISALGHCASLFNSSVHGATLVREIVTIAADIVDSIRSFLQTFLRLENGEISASANTAISGGDYLIKVGTVHDIIDKARGPSGISRDNVTAVRKKWAVDGAALEDCLRELDEMIENEEGKASGNDDGGGDDDGWDELGIPPGERMEKEELERTKAAHILLRLTTILHKRIRLDLLASTPSSSSITIPQNAVLDGFLAQSSILLATSDDLASSLYLPQDPQIINAELAAFVSVVESLQTGVQDFFSTKIAPGEQVGILSAPDDSVSPNKSGGKKDIRLWFTTCFKQIYKASKTFSATLVQGPTHPADGQ